MFIINLLGFIALQSFVLNVVNGDNFCDDIDGTLTACKCLKAQNTNGHMIECIGDEVDDPGLDGINLFNGTFYALIIQNTNITKINHHLLTGPKFQLIFIENNSLLNYISDDAFDKNSVEALFIRNNRKLDEIRTFDLAKTLSPKMMIDFRGNRLTKVPDNALGDNPSLRYIFLQNNNIKSIGMNAFKNFTNLTQIDLNNNELTLIEGLQFNQSSDKQQQLVSIFLQNNHLSETSFRNFEYDKNENVTIQLFLENNNFVKVPLGLKSFLTNTKNQLYFHNNKFQCDKDMKWVQQYPKQFFNLWCANLDEDINKVIL